jgi:predicted small secreted protein
MKVFVALILVSMLAACSTVAGMGKDLTSTAEWTKEKMGSSK